MRAMPHIKDFSSDQLETLNECPYCHSISFDAMFYENGFPLVQCRQCDLMFLQQRVKFEHVHLIYDAPYHGSDNFAYAKRIGEKRYALIEDRLPRGASIFEDGAGDGSFVAACRQNGHDVQGCDLGLDAVREAKASFDVDLFHGHLDDAQVEPGSLDAFVCFNLLCHLYEPWEYIKKVRTLLKPGGLWFFRTGNRRHVMKWVNRGHWSAPEHVFHFNTNVIESMLDQGGMKLAHTSPAFDSDFPYFLYNTGKSGDTGVHKLTRRLTSYSCLAWTLAGLPKEDEYFIAVAK